MMAVALRGSTEEQEGGMGLKENLRAGWVDCEEGGGDCLKQL